jgi:hypothetical protein
VSGASRLAADGLVVGAPGGAVIRNGRLTDHPVLTLNYYGPGRYDFGAGWGREGSEFILPVSPRLAVCTQVGRKETGPWHATPT